jgi:hypothetical protein
MSLFRRYSFEIQYLFSPEYGVDGGPQEHIFHASVVDNQLQQFATGLGYTRIEREDAKSGNRYDLAFSIPLSEALLAGANFKYLNFDRGETEDAINAVSVDVGLLMRTGFGLALGVTGYNLTNPADYLEHPISMAVALMYSPFRSLELAFDWFINFQRPVNATEPLGEKETGYRFHFGAEYLLMGQFTVRAGYLIDQAAPGDEEQFWSVGAGYVTQRFAFDFGYRGSTENTSSGVFGFGIRLFM